MTKEQTIMLNEFFKREDVQALMNDNMKKIATKFDLMAEYSLLREECESKLAEINLKIVEIDSPKKAEK